MKTEFLDNKMKDSQIDEQVIHVFLANLRENHMHISYNLKDKNGNLETYHYCVLETAYLFYCNKEHYENWY